MNAFDLNASNSQPSIDRCRGGILSITLVIPSQVLNVINPRDPQGKPAPGFVVTKPMTTTLAIDFESLPLTNVAGYNVPEVQVAPPVIPYPTGAVPMYTGLFI